MEVEKLQAAHPDLEVRWVPFFLDPTIPPEGRTRQPQTSTDTPKSHLELRGEASGITFRRGRTFTPNSHLALQLNEFAYDHGATPEQANSLHRALFKAHFDDFDNIGEIDTLARIAGEQGFDAAEAQAALEADTYRDEVDTGIQWSRGVGVTGIPTFIFNQQYAVVGAQEYEVFEQVMQRLSEMAADEP